MNLPQTKESELIAAINALGEEPNEFSLRKIYREVEKAKPAIGIGTYYVFQGMLATIKKSFHDAVSFHETALKHSPTQWAYGAYAASLTRLGYHWKALQMYTKSYELDQSDTSYLVCVTNAQLRLGLYDSAAEVLETLDEDTTTALKIDKEESKRLYEFFQALNISEDEVTFIVSAGEDVLFKKGALLSKRRIIYADSDEQFIVFDGIATNLTPSQVLDANVEICELLAERDVPSNFTGKVIFRALSPR